MPLTTTSYAILGLLSLRDWSAYDLAQQAGRSLAFAWPVSESQLYAEPKRLAAEGLISISEEPAGPRRQRQRFSITPRGREELTAWLRGTPAAPRLQAEILLRCLLAVDARDPDLVAALRETHRSVTEQIDSGMAFVDGYVHGDNPFPERLATNVLWMLLVRDVLQLLADWSAFAGDQLEHGVDSERAERMLQALHRSGGPTRYAALARRLRHE